MNEIREDNYKKIFKSLKDGQRLLDLCSTFDCTPTEAKGLIEVLKVRGYDVDIVYKDNEFYIKKKNIVRTNRTIKPSPESLNHIKLCIVSDTHLCTTIQQLNLLNKTYKEAYDRGIHIILHCGDVIDGDFTKIRPAQNYDLFKRGFDEQADYVIDMYPKVDGITTYFIEGSHDQTHVKNGGATPGIWIEKLRDDMKYLGTPEATVEIDKVKIKMQHPGGGCARSLSYKPQIAIDEMETNEKPNIFLQGHFHKAYGCVYRNVYAYLVPSFMDQSGFMKMNNIRSIVGAYFMDIYADKNGHIEYLDVDPYIYGEKDIDKEDYRHVKKLVIK